MAKTPAPNAIFALEKRIRDTAKQLDRLKNGALTASFGGGIVVGLVGGALWWIPAAMSGSLLLYRGMQFLVERQDNAKQRRLEEWDEVFKRAKELHGSSLPTSEKNVLGGVLHREIPAPREVKLLPPPESPPTDQGS